MALIVRTLTGNIVHERPPDGGWAWVVLFASFLNTAIAYGIAKGLGIFFIAFKDEFGATNSQVSLVLSITIALFGLGAPFATCLQHSIGSRKVILLSGVLCCVGMIVGSFATSIGMVYVGIGLINGIGFSWSFATCLSQVGMYFGKRRPIANGLTCAGSSVASMLVPFLSDFLLGQYGWRGTLIVFAGIVLNISVCGALIRPISILGIQDAKGPGQPESVALDNNSNPSIAKHDVDKENHHGYIHRIQTFFWTYWVVMLLGLCEIVTCMGLFVPITFIVPFARALGCTMSEATIILSMFSVGDVICRPLGGVIITLVPVLERHLLLYISMGSFAMALVQILAATSEGFAPLVAYGVLFGVIYGLLTPASITAVPILLGLENIQKYMGLKFFASGIASFFGAPIAGYLIDVFGTYRVAYWYVLITFTVTGILYCAIDRIVNVRGGVLSKQEIQEPLECLHGVKEL